MKRCGLLKPSRLRMAVLKAVAITLAGTLGYFTLAELLALHR